MSTGHTVTIHPNGGAKLNHVHVGDGCDNWTVTCNGDHIWWDFLKCAVTSDMFNPGTPEGREAWRLYEAIADEDIIPVWCGGKPHQQGPDGEWLVPYNGCGFLWAEQAFDLPDDLPPGEYEVECEQWEWGAPVDVTLSVATPEGLAAAGIEEAK